MRVLRNLLYMTIGLLLGGYAVLSHAGTYPAKLGFNWGGTTHYDVSSWFSAWKATAAVCISGGGYTYECTYTSHVMYGNTADVKYHKTSTNLSTGVVTNNDPSTSVAGSWGCPSGGTLSNVNGSYVCTKACPVGQDLQSDGTCKDPLTCKGNQTPIGSPATCGCNLSLLNFNSGPRPWLSGAGSTVPSTICDGGCTRNLGFGLGGGASWTAEGGAFSGATCAEGEALPPKEPVPNKTPPCGAAEGVMTSSSGTVACVPEGTPDARKPQIETKKKVETYPDNSTKTTETTTTTDPATGTKDVTTTSTSSGGSSGTAGTTTSKEQTNSTGGGNSGSGTGTDGTGNSGDGDGDCEGEDCGEGSELPDTSDLYEKKYPDGLTKVINDKITALKSTALGNLVGKLVPNNLPSAGACPAYSFSFNIGPKMSFGGHTLAMPCGVWDFIRLVFLCTALLLARRLIFGG